MSDDPYRVPDEDAEITEPDSDGCGTIVMWAVVAAVGLSFLANIIHALLQGW